MKRQAPYIFHGHDVSYYSGKIRPAFPQKNLWVREVLPDIREIKRRTGMAMFPAVVTPEDELWQDTSDILDRLEVLHPEPPLYPRTPVQRVVSYLVELYGDEIGSLPAMHYRWSFDESVEKVGVDFSTPTGDPEGDHGFAKKMRGVLPSMGVTPETIPAIEAHTAELIRRFDRAPKPMAYQPEFLDACWTEYLSENKCKEGDVDPDAFIRWTYARALAHRLPRYESMAKWGVTVTADEVSSVKSADDFTALIVTALESAP